MGLCWDVEIGTPRPTVPTQKVVLPQFSRTSLKVWEMAEGHLCGADIQIRRNLSSFPGCCDKRLVSAVTTGVGKVTWLGFQEPLCLLTA